jgi:hypothetical protein
MFLKRIIVLLQKKELILGKQYKKKSQEVILGIFV